MAEIDSPRLVYYHGNSGQTDIAEHHDNYFPW
jgi:hypothetical protein